ncbi:MAG: PLP-dependent cysteine synthase family protein [Anaerovoracaceae bacterium]|jgi:cysteine synthase A
MVYNTILEAVGNTPMIRLQHLPGPEDAEILVKMEALNVGGSIKTRTAMTMIEEAEMRGELKQGSIIVEPTSGNQGVGLALVGAVMGYRTVIIMPDSVSRERRMLVSQYGAEVKLIHDDGDIGEAIDHCITLAHKMKEEDNRVFVPDQFSNRDNIKAHMFNTATEILEQVRGPIHGFCSGVGTGGTLTGIGTVLKEVNPDIRIYAAEPENAAVLAGGNVGTHLQMGIGDGLVPDILDTTIYQHICLISDEEAIEMTRRLAREEGLMVGISSGTNVCVALKMARELGRGKTVVTILPDTGERYFSTPLFKDPIDEK